MSKASRLRLHLLAPFRAAIEIDEGADVISWRGHDGMFLELATGAPAACVAQRVPNRQGGGKGREA